MDGVMTLEALLKARKLMQEAEIPLPPGSYPRLPKLPYSRSLEFAAPIPLNRKQRRRQASLQRSR